MKTAIVWFRKDLRLHDHEALHKAIKEADQIIPFYCFEAAEYGKGSFGLHKSGPFRTQFNIESVANLKDSLNEIGAELYIRKGNTADEIAKLAELCQADQIYAYKDIHQEEVDIQEEVEKKVKIPVSYFFGSALYHVNDLPHAKRIPLRFIPPSEKGLKKKQMSASPFLSLIAFQKSKLIWIGENYPLPKIWVWIPNLSTPEQRFRLKVERKRHSNG